MERIKKFFWMCSGADLSTLKRTPTESNKFIGIGGTIFFTAVLAFISSSYAIYTVFDSYLSAAFFGLIWALMIFNLDRYIVSSMKNNGKFWNDFFIATPRIVIAVFLAIVISKPLELKIFEKEINTELTSMEQEIKLQQETKLKNRFTENVNFHQRAINELKKEISDKETERNALALAAMQEADGTGGSGVKNLGPIYKAKKAEADKSEQELLALKNERGIQIAIHQKEINTLAAQEKKEVENLPKLTYNGFAARLDALGRLTDDSRTMAIASIFIVLLFICLETAPIMVKLISNKGPYDLKLDVHEHAFTMNHQERTSEQFNNMKNKVKYYTETNAYRLRAEIEAEKEWIDYHISKKLNGLKNKEVNWENRKEV